MTIPWWVWAGAAVAATRGRGVGRGPAPPARFRARRAPATLARVARSAGLVPDDGRAVWIVPSAVWATVFGAAFDAVDDPAGWLVNAAALAAAPVPSGASGLG